MKVSADQFIGIEGLAPRAGMSDVLQRNFCKRLDEITGERRPVAESWPIAFARLDGAIPSRGRTVVLLDEIPGLEDRTEWGTDPLLWAR